VGEPQEIGLFALAIILAALWIRSETNSASPSRHEDECAFRSLDDQLGRLLFGFGMYVMFTIVRSSSDVDKYPTGWAPRTQSGLDLLPFAAAMFVHRAAHADCRRPSAESSAARRLLFSAVLHRLDVSGTRTRGRSCWQRPPRIGIAWGYAAMSNLVVEPCAIADGVATGNEHQHPQRRRCVGAGVATSIVVSTLLRMAHRRPTATSSLVSQPSPSSRSGDTLSSAPPGRPDRHPHH